ncbi:MAG TPA: hypothetical protein VF062_03325 [Candidatus Limnocylindrales bacterium]
MVEREGSKAAYEQAGGFTFLADLLHGEYQTWQVHRDRIAQIWESPAAQAFLQILDQYGDDLAADEACARRSAFGWYHTVSALDDARKRIAPVRRQWDNVTSSYVPLQWPARAWQLNLEARQVMVETDRRVAEVRPYFTPPRSLAAVHSPEGGDTATDPKAGPVSASALLTGAAGGGTYSPRIPPVPGYEPVTTVVAGPPAPPELATIGGPEMQSIPPKLVPAVPGTPVSMLPIPPGNPYAPFGGAYILPGRGVGPGGYVVPMPQPPRGGPVAGPRGMMPTASGGGGGGGMTGMMPMPIAGAPGAGAAGQGRLYRRPNVQWQADEGVPAVISIEQDDYVPDQPSPQQEEQFRDWFSELAHPWESEFKSHEGAKVTFRSVTP